jgi:ribosomal protein S27AE
MTTTFQQYANATRHNYCTLPTADVEILPDVRHCETCGNAVSYSGGTLGSWSHTDPFVPDHGYVRTRLMCPYCHTEDGVVFRQHPWHDAVECSRCGGVDGRAISD